MNIEFTFYDIDFNYDLQSSLLSKLIKNNENNLNEENEVNNEIIMKKKKTIKKNNINKKDFVSQKIQDGINERQNMAKKLISKYIDQLDNKKIIILRIHKKSCPEFVDDESLISYISDELLLIRQIQQKYFIISKIITIDDDNMEDIIEKLKLCSNYNIHDSKKYFENENIIMLFSGKIKRHNYISKIETLNVKKFLCIKL